MSPREPADRTERLERLMEVSRHLGTSLELETMLQSVIDAACELTDSQSSSILLYEEETDLLKFVAGSKSEKEILKRIRVPLEKSIAGRVYLRGEPVIIANARIDPLMFRDVENALGREIRNLIAVPMIFRGEPIGVIESVNKRENAAYTEEDVTILETLANQSAIAILSTLMLEEMKRAYDELEESERKKTDFIAIASHELRTPLGLILGHATFLYDTSKDDAFRQQLGVIVRSANRLKKIIEDFSSVSSTQESSSQVYQRRTNLVQLIQHVVSSFKISASDKHISLATELPKNDLVIYADEEKLSIALANLVENALTFTDLNGHVLISAEKLPGYAKVSVIDDGIGIPSKDLPHVFERFYQVENHLTRHHGGMGLGLSVAKTMIEMHDGQIWCESIENKGSNFSFLIPVKDEQATRPNGRSGSPKIRPFE